MIEAKAAAKSYTEGVGQAKDYATCLATRFAFATNGRAIYRVDMATGAEELIERWPSPDELWAATYAEPNAWRDRFAAVPLQTNGRFEPRYYQYNAIQRTLDAIADGRGRILLTLATGTGKTAIAFQIAWKLFGARWNIGDWKSGGEPGDEPPGARRWAGSSHVLKPRRGQLLPTAAQFTKSNASSTALLVPVSVVIQNRA